MYSQNNAYMTPFSIFNNKISKFEYLIIFDRMIRINQ